MTLREITKDIHALNEELQAFEEKYGLLSEDFYEMKLCRKEAYDYKVREYFQSLRADASKGSLALTPGHRVRNWCCHHERAIPIL